MMFYALTPPYCESDRVRLYPTREAAIAQAGDDSPVYAIAVEFDKAGRLVVPCWVIPQAVETDWTTPAELHGDGSLTAKGTIPKELFVGCVHSPRRSCSGPDSRVRWRKHG
jgi:hypothetical protein